MKKTDIISAYCRIRDIDNTIPDDVLDFMRNSAIEKLEQQEREDKDGIKPNPKYLNMFRGTCKLTGNTCFGSYLKESYHCNSCGGYEHLTSKSEDGK